jgi:UDP:flavonoid glycosyltransferase YjiC (YdhE family)
MRILFTTAPLSGHYFPLVPLAWACRSIGHEVLVATSGHYVGTVLQSGLPAIAAGPGIRLSELADSGAQYGIGHAPYAHGRVFARMASRNLHGMLVVMDSWQPDVVVSERAELAGPIAAAARGTPYVELRWGVAELAEYRTAADDTLGAWLSVLGLTELPVPELTLDPWPPSLRLPHAEAHSSLRHVPYDGVSQLSDWMWEAGRRPRICLTLGTVLPHLATRELVDVVRQLLEALANLDHELVVAVDEAAATGLRPLPAGVRYAGRLPLSGVLGRCHLLVHHGGQGTALTALAAGCPQVVFPIFDDELENAAAVVASGAGLSIPLSEADAGRITDGCRQVLGGPGFWDAAAAVAEEISAQPSPVDVATRLGQLR